MFTWRYKYPGDGYLLAYSSDDELRARCSCISKAEGSNCKENGKYHGGPGQGGIIYEWTAYKAKVSELGHLPRIQPITVVDVAFDFRFGQVSAV